MRGRSFGGEGGGTGVSGWYEWLSSWKEGMVFFVALKLSQQEE